MSLVGHVCEHFFFFISEDHTAILMAVQPSHSASKHPRSGWQMARCGATSGDYHLLECPPAQANVVKEGLKKKKGLLFFSSILLRQVNIMAFRLRKCALPPPTSRLRPFREIQRGWQQSGESCKARRRLPQKQDVGLESTDMFALLQTEGRSRSLAALSSAADSAGSLDVTGQCGKLS